MGFEELGDSEEETTLEKDISTSEDLERVENQKNKTTKERFLFVFKARSKKSEITETESQLRPEKTDMGQHESWDHHSMTLNEVLTYADSLTQMIEYLGGDASYTEREKFFNQAKEMGMDTDEEYKGSLDQNIMLLAFLKVKLQEEQYYWSTSSNQLEKISERLDDTPQAQIERYVSKKTGLDIENLNDSNRIQVLREMEQYLKENPGFQIPIEFVQKIMENPRSNMITIDDGPNENTPQILDTLKKAGITAMFYLIGENIKKHPDHVKRIVDEGHIIGYHSMTHSVEGLSQDTLEQDFIEYKQILDETLEYEYPLIFLRMPYGKPSSFYAYNEIKASSESLYSTNYLSKGTGLVRDDNWDIVDDKFRGPEWSLDQKGLEAKKEFYRNAYENEENNVFLLHQESDDLETLRNMLEP